MTTGLTCYYSNFASVTLSTANQLFISGGSPSTNATYSTIGNNVTGFGELASQGAAIWAALGAIGNPTGKGYLLESLSLAGKEFPAGNWTFSTRLNASQFPTFTQAGTLIGDIYMRAFKLNLSGMLYTPIASASLANQTLTGTFTTYAVGTVSGVKTLFGTHDVLYVDSWFNCTTNANGSALQGVRQNRLSTDGTTHIGDTTVSIITPGYEAIPAPTGNMVARYQARHHFGRMQ